MSLTEEKNRNPRIDHKILIAKKEGTIEHVYPQEDTDEYWVKRFGDLSKQQKKYYKNAIGNLLILSRSINASLQNFSFEEKKKVKLLNDGKTKRTAYEEGSYSEQEVAKEEEWTKETIIKRSRKLIEFMEKRWDITFDESFKEMLIDPSKFESDKIQN